MAATTTTTAGGGTQSPIGGGAKKEIYTHEAPWLVYGLAWSNRPGERFRLALASFEEDYTNQVEIVQLVEAAGTTAADAGRAAGDEAAPGAVPGNDGAFVRRGNCEHPYPATKVLWAPASAASQPATPDLFATTGDYLRIWEVTPNGPVQKCLLNTNKSSEFCAPLTSFDWNEKDPTIIGTASIDTTCTIWNVEREQAHTQLIAHDREVFDIAFSTAKTNVFASVGADGSVRMFDLRQLETSTIIYECSDPTPLLRLCWNRQDEFYLATFAMDSSRVVVLDIRMPSLPAAELAGHNDHVNALAWAPHSSCHLVSAGEDAQALIWDLSALPKAIEDPILSYQAGGEISNLHWSQSQPDWIAISYGRHVQILRV